MKLFKIYLIVLLILVNLVYARKAKIIDTHKAWDHYPSTSISGDAIRSLSIDTDMIRKLNKDNMNYIIDSKLRHLRKTADLLLSEGNDDEYRAHINIGIMYAKSGFFSNAFTSFSEALKIQQTTEVFNNIANLYYITGKNDKAIQFYKQALKIHKLRVCSFHSLLTMGSFQFLLPFHQLLNTQI